MNDEFTAAMRRAARATRSQDLTEATRIIQEALAQRPASARPDISFPDTDSPQPERGLRAGASQRLRRPLGEVVRTLREGQPGMGAFSRPGMDMPGVKRPSPPPMPDGAQFVTRSFSCAAGRRNYKLYIPASAPHRPRGLVVMLHGCKQDPDDFAAGTTMNAVAETHGLLVAYPGQVRSANASSCWNWFNPADQRRDAGEPSIIAGITREIMAEFGVGRTRTFVAGLSAGGAMAAVMAETYPDLYAAAGIHSGLAYGCANDVMSAFAVMRGEAGLGSRVKRSAATEGGPRVRMIVFQGSADRTVHPSNADRIVASVDPGTASGGALRDRRGSAGGRTYARAVIAGPDGIPVLERWMIDGAGHAWSGGHSSGSYADPRGPDASSEMVRFFLGQQETGDVS